MNGGFSPLDQFMDEATYKSVVDTMRLDKKFNNLLFPLPITLDVSEKVSFCFSRLELVGGAANSTLRSLC